MMGGQQRMQMWLVDNSGILALVRVTNTVVHTSQALFEFFFFFLFMI